MATKRQACPCILCGHSARPERTPVHCRCCGSVAIPQDKPRKAEFVMKAGVSAASAQLWRVAAGTGLRPNVFETYGTPVLGVARTFATAVGVARELGPTRRGFYSV